MEAITEDEIEKLAPWACIAFAARCARRVLPLLNHHWPPASIQEPDTDDFAVIYAAVADAEQAASLATSSDSDIPFQSSEEFAEPFTEKANLIALAAYDAALTACDARQNPLFAYRAMLSAQAAVEAAHQDWLRAAPDEPDGMLTIAVRLAQDIVRHHDIAVRHDIELLKISISGDAAVAPDFFGPIWPFGKPLGWPNDDALPAESQAAYLEIDAPAEASDEEIERLVLEAASRANALHMAYGGSGLKVDDLQVWLPAGVPMEVGQ